MPGKVGILCTMINGFGRRGYYNSQEIGLGRALARMGAEVWIYKGVRRHEPAGLERLSEGVTIEYIPMRGMGAHGYLDCSRLDRGLCGLFCFGDQQIFLRSGRSGSIRSIRRWQRPKRQRGSLRLWGRSA